MVIRKHFKYLPCLIFSPLIGYYPSSLADENMPDDYKTGQWIEIPNDFVPEDKLLVLLKDEPKVTMTDDWTARIDFETITPVHEPTIYYGVYAPDTELNWPHYLRFDPNEKTGELTTQHSIAISGINSGFLRPGSDINNMNGKGGG